MSDRTLLASVVLFRELYDSDKDVYDVIAEFIKASLLFSQRWIVNTTEVAHLLESEFELTLPEAVVGTALHKRLYKRDNLLSFDKGSYSTSQEQLSASRSLVDELSKLRQTQDAVLARLTRYVERTGGPLNEERRELLANCFCDYLFDHDRNTRFSENISAFIIASRKDAELTEQLNAVREGFVLYDGVRHSPDISSISHWKSKLSVFLDTEHLFNAVGMNGSLHEQLFRDFLNLVNEVRGKDGRMISLRYFSECADEVERFFRVAEHIIEGKATLDPSKPAMAAILQGCSTKADVVTKKARFFTELKSKGIYPADSEQETAAPQFNVESTSILDEIRGEIENKGRDFHEDKCLNTLRMFTKINTIRRGDNQRSFEEAGAILVSGSHIANFVAFHESVRSGDAGAPYSTDLEFVTNRLWFKLHKNLAKGVSHPQSLSVLAKAQVVLSSQLQNSVSDKFDKIKKDYESGVITEDQTKFLFNDLRSHASLPEALNETNIESVLTFLDHKDYEHHLRERSALEKQAEDGRAAVRELHAIQRDREALKIKLTSYVSGLLHFVAILAVIGCIVGAFYCTYLLLDQVGTGENESLTILGIIATLVVGLLPLIGWRRITKWLSRSHSAFINRICGEGAWP